MDWKAKKATAVAWIQANPGKVFWAILAVVVIIVLRAAF
jgi:hypothetical protein